MLPYLLPHLIYYDTGMSNVVWCVIGRNTSDMRPYLRNGTSYYFISVSYYFRNWCWLMLKHLNLAK